MYRITVAPLLFAATLFVVGCGKDSVPVNGVVELDGKAVDGATVTFVTEDGKQSASAQTDAQGNFSLTSGDKAGALPGTYKVTVVRNPLTRGGEAMTPGDPNYMKMMKANAPKQSGSPGNLSGTVMTSTPTAIKTDLPAVYADPSKTPITVKIPPDSQPVKIELKSKP